MSVIKTIEIFKDTSLYSSHSSTSTVKCTLPKGTIASRDMSTVTDNRFPITVKSGKYKGEKGWIEDNSSHYQYND